MSGPFRDLRKLSRPVPAEHMRNTDVDTHSKGLWEHQNRGWSSGLHGATGAEG